MKKLLSTIFLAAIGMTQAAQLYTVTVRLSPEKINADIYFINGKRGSPNEDSCMGIGVDSITCKIPAGTYELTVHDPDDRITVFPTVRRDFKIEQDTVIQQKVQLGIKGIAATPPDGVVAFRALQVLLDAKTRTCLFGDSPLHTCVASPLDAKAVRKIISENQYLRQTRPWEQTSLAGSWSSRFETNVENVYHITVYADLDGMTFVILYGGSS